jgi:hypothetical protein
MSADRIGVFVCSWGSGKDAKLDMEALRLEAEGIDGVVFSMLINRICSESGQREMVEAIKVPGSTGSWPSPVPLGRNPISTAPSPLPQDCILWHTRWRT